MISHENVASALSTFEQQKIITLPELASLLHGSSRSTQRRLKQWQALCSYNKNGRFYTLPDIARFDRNGLWEYKEVRFSKHGSLKQTLLDLVRNSPAGLDATEIGSLLHVAPHSFLSHFRTIPGMKRERHHNRFVYFSDAPDISLTQRTTREQAITEKTLQLPSDAQAVLILVDKIKHPGATIEECAERLRSKGTPVGVQVIRDLFHYHGVEKKTPGTFS